MNRITRKAFNNFDIGKNYKLFRKLQVLSNIPIKFNFSDYDLKFDVNIKLRVFNEKVDSNKLIIFFHGGGWLSGSVTSYTNVLSRYSSYLQIPIVAVSYRLAPEHLFPTGFNDCYNSVIQILKYLKDNKKNREVILMGDSAGGNLVAAVSQKLHDNNNFSIKKQVLLYPVLSGDYSKNSEFASVKEEDDNYFLTRKHLETSVNFYKTSDSDRNNPYFAPLKSKHLFMLPRTLIITCEFDPLKDEGKLYFKRLKHHLNFPIHYFFEGAYHGFLTNPLENKNKKKALELIDKFLN